MGNLFEGLTEALIHGAKKEGDSMASVTSVLGPGIILNILGMVFRPLLPWLKEQATKTETPIDNWAVEFLELIFGVKGE